jgi:hypothetical protein
MRGSLLANGIAVSEILDGSPGPARDIGDRLLGRLVPDRRWE